MRQLVAGLCALGLMASTGLSAEPSEGEVADKVAVPAGTLREFVEPAPITSAGPDELALFEPIRKNAMKWKTRPPKALTESAESYFWSVGSRLSQTMDAYQYSRDPALLESFVTYMDKVLADRYVHPTQPEVWIGWYHYKQGARPRYYMPIHGALVYYTPCLRFVAAVRAEPKLREKFGAKAEAYFRDIVEVEIPAWDKRGCWHDFGDGTGWYTKLKQYPDRETNELHPLVETEAGTTLAYNKVHAMIESMVLVYRMTGDPWYRERIEKCERFFRKRWREAADHVEWNYRDFSGPWDYHRDQSQTPEPGSSALHDGKRTWKGFFVHPKQGYYAADLRAIVDCYNAGLVFDEADMKALVKTNLDFMWNGDAEKPAYRQINGKPGKGVLWTALAQFDPRVLELWEADMTQFREQKGKASPSVMRYLLARARGVTGWAPLYGGDIPESAPATE